MNHGKLPVLGIALVAVLASGCAAYRTTSNIPAEAAPRLTQTTEVIISEDLLPDRRYEELGRIEVSVKKLTLFHRNPTRAQANQALAEKARIMGADAVIDVRYRSGIGFTTWGYMDARGIGVKLTD